VEREILPQSYFIPESGGQNSGAIQMRFRTSGADARKITLTRTFKQT
jgi:hypothetical protein